MGKTGKKIKGLQEMEGMGVEYVENTPHPGSKSWGKSAGQTAETGKPRMSETELVDKLYAPYLEENKPETKEAERKKRKRERIMAGISDGLTALGKISNWVSVMRGAPYAPDPVKHKWESEKLEKRYKKLDDDRKKNRLAYLNMHLKASMNDFMRDLRDREQGLKERAQGHQENVDNTKLSFAKDANNRANDANNREKDLHPYKLGIAEGQAQTAKAEGELAGKRIQSEINRNNRNNTEAASTRNAASRHTTRNTFLGKTYDPKSKDREKDIYEYAKANGISLFQTVKEGKGYNTKYKTVQKSVDQLAGEAEEHYKRKKQEGEYDEEYKPKSKK